LNGSAQRDRHKVPQLALPILWPHSCLSSSLQAFVLADPDRRLAFGTPVRTATLHVDQNKVPNNFLVNEPSWSTQGIGGSSGR
jgi:hypothetical protein